MTRFEAVIAVAVAVALVVCGVVWLWGAYGLIGSGVVLGLVTLFVFDVRPGREGEERRSAESVANPTRTIVRR